MTQWAPRAGWNSIFSAEEQQKGSDVFHNLMNTYEKTRHTNSVIRLTDATAETIVMMNMYQEKYPGLRYSEAQESILHQYIAPHVHKIPIVARVAPHRHATPFTHREHRAHASQPHTRTPYVALLSVHREQHQGEHRHKKENRLNEHPRHRESAVGQKRDSRPKEALKHPSGLGIRK